MGFVAGLALFGLVAIAIPIIIHLTKAKQAPVVWVGDIRLLKGQNAKRFRPTNIDNWPLFILRVLIVLAATLAAAKPYLHDADSGHRPLALLSPDWLVNASDEQIEQVTQAYEVRHLQESQLWAMLSYADEIQPQSQAFHVFTTDQLAPWYEHSRPPFSRELNWHIQALDKVVTPSPQALIISANSQMPALSVLAQALKLLGYEVNFAPTAIDNSQALVVIDVDNMLPLTADNDLTGVILKGGDWLQQYQQVDFIFALRQKIAAAYQQKPSLSLPPHFIDGKLTAEQLTVEVKPNLYVQTLKHTFYDSLFVMLLLILVVCERLLSEYGPNRRKNKVSNHDD